MIEGDDDQEDEPRKKRGDTKDTQIKGSEFSTSDEEMKDSRHNWNFCIGNSSVLLWNGMMQTMSSGDGIADIIIPDNENGFGSGGPGGPDGPGNTPTVPKGKGKGEGGVTCRPKGEGSDSRSQNKDKKKHPRYLLECSREHEI